MLSLTAQGMDVVPAEVWRVGPSWWGFTPMTFLMLVGVSSLGLDFPSIFSFCGSGERGSVYWWDSGSCLVFYSLLRTSASRGR